MKARYSLLPWERFAYFLAGFLLGVICIAIVLILILLAYQRPP